MRLVVFTLITGFAAGALIASLQTKPSAVAANPANDGLSKIQDRLEAAALADVPQLRYRVVRSSDGTMSTSVVEKGAAGAIASQ